MTCSTCAGLGSIEDREMVGSGDWRQAVVVRRTCPVCGGSGEDPHPITPVVVVVDPRSAWDRAAEHLARRDRLGRRS